MPTPKRWPPNPDITTAWPSSPPATTWAASRLAENQRLQEEEERHHEQLRQAEEVARLAQEGQRLAEEGQRAAEVHAADMRRRSRILRAVLAGTAIVALVAVIGFVQANRAERQATREARDALAAQLDTEASAALSRGTAGGNDVRALAQTLAAQRLRSDPAASRGTFYTATSALNTTRVIVPTPAPVERVAFSPDRHTLASLDGTVRLWNITDPAHPAPLGQPLTDHTSDVFSVAFSPDGHTLASGSDDGTVRLWNLTDPAHPTPLGQPLTGYTDPAPSVAFSPDGHTLARQHRRRRAVVEPHRPGPPHTARPTPTGDINFVES